jgi:hypothetical protein
MVSYLTRRQLLTVSMAPALPAAASNTVSIPVHRIVDSKAHFAAGSLERFWHVIWPQAVIDFGRGAIHLETTDGPGAIAHTAADRPIFEGLQRGALNLMLTDHLPLYWDNARSLPGVTTLDRGYHLSIIAVRFAHPDRAPFLSVNTCVHEMLHAILGDIFVSHPSAVQSTRREYRVDWYATRLWAFHDGGALRRIAQEYVTRLRRHAP